MIDLHNHILPGLDDGAADLEESLEIARQFVSEGVQTVAATPHRDPSRESGADPATVQAVLVTLRQAIGEASIDLEVLQGQELYFSPEALPLLEGGNVCTLGSSRALLIELPFETRPLYADDLLFRAELAGYRLILAHPERYRYVQRDISYVQPLVERGIALQVTAPALLGEYGPGVRKTADALVQRGFCSLAASDRHHPGAARSLALAHDRITQLTDSATADLLLVQNPRRVLDGEPLVLPSPVEPRKGGLFARLRRPPS